MTLFRRIQFALKNPHNLVRDFNLKVLLFSILTTHNAGLDFKKNELPAANLCEIVRNVRLGRLEGLDFDET
tara:strand:+ start:6723 stop:6935 length:213 start_codon:yes stop_codon:yes gene_type:complete